MNAQIEHEEWREIPDFGGRYEVSNQGQVRSWVNSHGERRDKPHVLKLRTSRYGYAALGLYTGSGYKNCFVHRLVMLAFVGESPMGVNHKNGVKTDNRLSNLEYTSTRENVMHARDVLGRKWGRKGEGHSQAKLTYEQVAEIRALCDQGLFAREIAAMFGVSRQQISKIKRGVKW